MSFYQGKKVLVTGGTGFIGTHFVQALLKQGARLRMTAHYREPAIKDPHIETMRVDLTRKEECLHAFRGMDYVFHAAGAVAGADVGMGENPMSAISTNMTLTGNALEAAWSVGVDRILIFGTSLDHPVPNATTSEADLGHPSHFGHEWMRRYVEQMCEFVSTKSKTKIVLVRPSCIFGPHDNFDSQCGSSVASLIRRVVSGENPLKVDLTAEEQHDLLYVDDFINGCLLAMEHHADCQPVGVRRNAKLSVSELMNLIQRLAGVSPLEVHYASPKPQADCPHLGIKDVNGFEPKVALEQGLEKTMQWYQESVAQHR